MVSYPGAADAIAGAATMQRAVERHNRKLGETRLAMRVGISAGDATFEDGDWFGTPVVESSRLCTAANGGQILVSDIVRVLAGTRTDLELRSLGELDLKGLPAPLAACEVTWQVAAAGEAEIPLPACIDVDPAFPFAGRAEYVERLITSWKETVEGARRAVLVSGEPGIGKTRIVTEVVRVAHDRGAVVLWGRCDEEVGAPYAPFAEALRHYVAVSPPERVRAELGALGGELVRIVPELTARVPGLAEPMRADADTERFRMFDGVADLLAEMSAARPVVLVLDDVHWADKPSLLLLRHLLRATAPMRLFVLATYRDTDLDRSHPLADVLADLRRQPGVERLDLQGLDEGEITSLMSKTAGHDLDAPALELAHMLHNETEGNPFFVGEVLRHLAESGAIVQHDGRWTAGLEGIGIPEGIREVIGRRLSRLSEDVNRALSVAAVIGPTFDLATIEGAGGPAGDALFDALDEATQHGLIREVRGAAGRYSFSHALMRSALYEELSTNRKVRMHWKVGEVLESRFASSVDSHLDELAYHFGEGALAGDPMKAVEYARRAGDRSIEDLAFEAAAAHFERALGSLELVDDASAEVRCDLLLERADALQLGGDEHRYAAVFEAAAAARAIGDADRLARAALVLVRGSTGSTRAGTVDLELVALLEEALAGIPTAPSPLRARLLSSLATELQWSGDHDRRMALARQALEMARATRDAEALGHVLGRSLGDDRLPAALARRLQDAPRRGRGRRDGNRRCVRRPRGAPLQHVDRRDDGRPRRDGVAVRGLLPGGRPDAAAGGERVPALRRGRDRGVLRTARRRGAARRRGRAARRARQPAGGCHRCVPRRPPLLHPAEPGQLRRAGRHARRSRRIAAGRAGVARRARRCARRVRSRRRRPLPFHVARRRRLRQRAARRRVSRDDRRPRAHGIPGATARARHAVDSRPAPAVRRLHELERRRDQRSERPRACDDLGRARTARRRRPLVRRVARALRTRGCALLGRTDALRLGAGVRGPRRRGPAREHAEIAVAMGEEIGMDGPFGIVPRGRALLETLGPGADRRPG